MCLHGRGVISYCSSKGNLRCYVAVKKDERSPHMGIIPAHSFVETCVAHLQFWRKASAETCNVCLSHFPYHFNCLAFPPWRVISSDSQSVCRRVPITAESRGVEITCLGVRSAGVVTQRHSNFRANDGRDHVSSSQSLGSMDKNIMKQM